jgi:hypothetical protein
MHSEAMAPTNTVIISGRDHIPATSDGDVRLETHPIHCPVWSQFNLVGIQSRVP